MAIRRPTQESIDRQRVLFDGFGDRERAALDLLSLQQETAYRPRLYRIMHTPPRQPEDVEMCHWLSWWLCQHYAGK